MEEQVNAVVRPRQSARACEPGSKAWVEFCSQEKGEREGKKEEWEKEKERKRKEEK